MMATTKVQEFTYTPNGVKVALISIHDDGEYMMVKSLTTGKVFFAHKNQIEETIVEQEAAPQVKKPTKQRRGRHIVKPEVPVIQRININSATPELLTQILKGVGIKTATDIKELQQSLPGERFTKLDQLKAISKVDWDSVLETGTVYVE